MRVVQTWGVRIRPQIVLDTSVLFAGLYSRAGAAFLVLDLVEKSQVGIHLSVPLVLEYEGTLKRCGKRLKMSAQEIDATVNALCALGRHHKIHYLWRPTLIDPGDDLVLEVAVTAQCRYIVTHNRRHFQGIGNFGIVALDPLQFLRTIGARS